MSESTTSHGGAAHRGRTRVDEGEAPAAPTANGSDLLDPALADTAAAEFLAARYPGVIVRASDGRNAIRNDPAGLTVEGAVQGYTVEATLLGRGVTIGAWGRVGFLLDCWSATGRWFQLVNYRRDVPTSDSTFRASLGTELAAAVDAALEAVVDAWLADEPSMTETAVAQLEAWARHLRIATSSTAGYLLCTICEQIYDVSPGERIECPTVGCPGDDHQ